MRSIFNIPFYINKNKLKTDGTTTILCRITIDSSNVVMTTGENVSPRIGVSSDSRQAIKDRMNACRHSVKG